MATSTILAALFALSGAVTTGGAAGEAKPKEAPEHQVVAIYFHRTVRCPTCKRIGAMSEDAVTTGFKKETKARTVEFHFVDFQDKKNAKLAKACGVDSPVLVLLNVYQGETVCWTSLPKVWQLVGKPEEFRTYVHEAVVRFLKQTKKDAERERENSKESKE
ncbi:MAG: hypothetical protein KDA44_04370 [Planctomycetales bacterium]|nr:hypothetical protein [Planctomycetales bacterium]